jgi:hypothetical protein
MAKTYFEDLGFVCPPGVNTADFLTLVTVPTERQVKPGSEKNNRAELYRTRSHL